MSKGAKNSVTPNGSVMRRDRESLALSREDLIEKIFAETGFNISISTLQRAERNFSGYKISKQYLDYIAQALGQDDRKRYELKSIMGSMRKQSGDFSISHELYEVSEILEIRLKDSIVKTARITLADGATENSNGYMDISVKQKPNLRVERYAFSNSFSHLYFSPGKIIIPSEPTTAHLISNGFSVEIDYDLQFLEKTDSPLNYIKCLLHSGQEVVIVSMNFSISGSYSGPPIRSRNVYLGKGIGIIYSENLYEDGKTDKAFLTSYLVREKSEDWFPVSHVGNYWEYEINHQNPINKTNFSE